MGQGISGIWTDRLQNNWTTLDKIITDQTRLFKNFFQNHPNSRIICFFFLCQSNSTGVSSGNSVSNCFQGFLQELQLCTTIGMSFEDSSSNSLCRFHQKCHVVFVLRIPSETSARHSSMNFFWTFPQQVPSGNSTTDAVFGLLLRFHLGISPDPLEAPLGIYSGAQSRIHEFDLGVSPGTPGGFPEQIL